MIDDSLMRFEERAGFALRKIYSRYGYLPYKMSKFEEYDLYVRNKDFLVSDRVITFNDTNGKLMALKPDVTLSIIKNGEDQPGIKQKVYYNENVYRVSESTHRYKEIMQTGLECIGDVDIYDIFEVISLAAESLSTVSEEFCIEISNLDLVYSVISGLCGDADFIRSCMTCISEKNSHELKNICDTYGIAEAGYEKLALFISVYGSRSQVIEKLQRAFDLPEMRTLCLLSELLDTSVFSDKIRFDFSVVNDMNYYNGFVFKGFIDGICCGVLAGGQYDGMMKKMNRKSGAVGFALYLDYLDGLAHESREYDADYLLIYDNQTDPMKISSMVSKLIATGASVTTQKTVPEKLRYKKLIDMRKKEDASC